MNKNQKNLISANNFTLIAEDRVLISNSSFSISSTEKVGLVGRNGAGKSTLFRLIVSLCEKKALPEHVQFTGNIKIEDDISIGYLPQEVQITYPGTVDDYLKQLSPSEKPLMGHFLNQKQKLIDSLELDSILNNQISSLSGGQYSKLGLAKIILLEPDLIIMDEPTNNLDFKAINFLASKLKNSNQAFFVVSHDRDFLDETINIILEIDEESLEIKRYGGNYSFYKEKKSLEFESRKRQFKVATEKQNRLTKDSKRLKNKARSYEEMSTNSFQRTKGAKLARKARVQLSRIEKELEGISKPKMPKLPSIKLLDTNIAEKDILISLKNISFSFDQQHKLLEKVSFDIYRGDKIAIIGPNGSGKSTLLKILTGALGQDLNQFRKENIKIGHLQQFSDFPKEKRIIEFIKEQNINLTDEEINKAVGRILLRNFKKEKLGSLSLGEIQRMQFFLMLAVDPDLIILDEPTNHLDIYTLELFENLLKSYNGAIILVSHDKRFLKNLGIKSIYFLDKNHSLNHLNVTFINDIDTIFNSNL